MTDDDIERSSGTGGAGRGGGLLFVGVLLFSAYLALTLLAGVLRFLFSVTLVALAIAVVVMVLRRR